MKIRASAWLLFVLAILIFIAIAILNASPVNLLRAPMPSTPINTAGTASSLPFLADPVASLPEFAGITRWWNTPDNQPLTPAGLKGKVVLVDFWTYSCINCIRTQPVLKQWWNTYEKDGLVIVGVHTPEFEFEKDPANVGDAIQKAGLKYPIALDPDYATWNAYANQYWPAEYLFDRNGKLRYTHFGEGNYQESEDAIRSLLAETGKLAEAPTGADTTPQFGMIQTPETYFGYQRMSAFANQGDLKRDQPATYQITKVGNDQWSIGGSWQIGPEDATSRAANNTFQMDVGTNAMYLVLGSTDGAKRIQVTVDGKPPKDENLTADTQRQTDGTVLIPVSEKQLYRIARFPAGGRHLVTLTILDPGVQFYAATFGE